MQSGLRVYLEMWQSPDNHDEVAGMLAFKEKGDLQMAIEETCYGLWKGKERRINI